MNTQTTNRRTKQVFSTNEVPHLWANQSQNSARNAQGNVFFEGRTIFSYGKHFPIATIQGNDVLFTLRSYSNTTAKHISHVRGAISHKNIIWCNAVPVPYYGDRNPVNKQSFTLEHMKNLNYWKNQLTELFTELGNKRNRDIAGRITQVNRNIAQLQAYCTFFNLPIKDKEIKSLILLSQSTDFIEKAREARKLKDANDLMKLQTAEKAHNKYIALWRLFDTEGIKSLPDKTKELSAYYTSHSQAFTRLRLNEDKNRVETSKGIEIPVEIAHRAYLAIKDCTNCIGLNVSVLSYSITEANKEFIKAGCHTIPQADVKYIAGLLNW